MKFRTLIITVISGVAGLASCTDNVLMHKYASVNDRGWNKKDSLTFEVPEVKDSGNYEVSLGLRLLPKYAYSNLWLIVEQHYTMPKKDIIDTLQLNLSDAEGNPKGKGVAFDEYETCIDTLQFPTHQKGSITVRHFMNDSTVANIHDIGIRIVKQGVKLPAILEGKLPFFEIEKE